MENLPEEFINDAWNPKQAKENITMKLPNVGWGGDSMSYRYFHLDGLLLFHNVFLFMEN